MNKARILNTVLIFSFMTCMGCDRSVSVEPEKGNIHIELDQSSPEARTVPKNSRNILFGVFKFSADEDDVEIRKITFTRAGTGLAEDFDGVKLLIDGIQITSTIPFDTSSNKVTFDFSPDPLVVPNSESISVYVRADMYAMENSENQVCIMSPEAVVAYSLSSGAQLEPEGDMPVCGNEVRTQGFTDELIEFKETFSVSDMNIMDSNTHMTTIEFFNDNSRDAYAEQLTIRVHTAPMDFENPTLYSDGNVIGDETNIVGDTQFVTYDLGQAPLLIPAHGSASVEFRMDLIWGICQHLGASLHHTDSVIIGENAQEMILIYHPESETYSERLAVGEAIQFFMDSDTPSTTTVTQGADDHIFAEVALNAGFDSTIEEFQINVLTDEGTENYFTDAKAWMQNQNGDWTVVATSSTANCVSGMCTYTFPESFDVAQCTDTVLNITMDVDPNTPLGTTGAVQYLPHSTRASITVSGDPILPDYIFGNNTLTGNVQTVVAP